MAASASKEDGERLSATDVVRYSRQMLVPGFFGGARGQLRLKAASALVIGCGGLGCPAAMALAGAGVGTLTLVDDDVVTASNLHRQTAHTDAGAREGVDKASSLARAVTALNPHIRVNAVRSRFGSSEGCGLDLVKRHSVVLDCTDNPGSRYLVGDACAIAKVPLVSAAALGCNGQLSVYGVDGGPCYRCVHPRPPPRVAVGSCDEQGVLGPVTGTMGSLQALEAIKVLARAPLTAMLSGRLLVVDAEDMRMRTVRIRGRRADCPACAGEDSWTLTQTKAFLEEHQVSVSEGAADSKPACAACDEAAATTAEPAADASEPSTNEVPVSILGPMATGAAGAVGTASYMPLGGRAASDSELQLLEIGSPSRAEAGTPDAEPTKCLVLDVRSVVQRGMCRLPKTLHVPLANLQAAESDGRGSTAAINPLTALRSYMDEAGASGIITLCRRGIDSLTAAELLSRIGIPSWSAKGGLVAFASECDSSFPSY